MALACKDGELARGNGVANQHRRSANGTPYWDTGVTPGQPHVADFDGDKQPEVLITNQDGMSLYTHDGTKLWGPVGGS